MKIGTIIKNHWAGYKNPIRFFIYTGIQGSYATGIYLDSGRLGKTRHYKHDIQDKSKYEEVGYCRAFDLMKSDLEHFLNGNKNENQL